MAFDQLGDDAEQAVDQFARITARQARASGIHVSFAPVADVNTDPRNPIIATRAFSNNPARAAQLAATYVRAAEAEGLLTSAKHFPGHGNTHQDSHDALPVVDRSRDELDRCDLEPFRACIAVGTSIVMTAHVAYPQLDPSGLPATLSRAITTDLLRGELGFTGAVCSDSLLMAGVRERFDSEGELVLAALLAGVDMLLDVADVDAAVDYLARAVERGDLPETRVDEALARGWQIKRHHGMADHEPDAMANAESAAAQAAASVARAAVTIVDGEHLPLDTTQPLTCLLVGPVQSYRRPEDDVLRAALGRYFHEIAYTEVEPDVPADQLDALLAEAVAAEQLVIAIIVKPAAWHRFGLTEGQQRLVQSCIDRRSTVVASLGVPQVLDGYPAATARLCTFSDVPFSQRALADVLAGVPIANENG
jgi:beta-glucosidase-like glycosyl hydrolase